MHGLAVDDPEYQAVTHGARVLRRKEAVGEDASFDA